ncbi:MAG: divalent-cation tolerance protein CutA [Candidatus Omnitrophica bacterium]|nr:divalent-cation tolerance protein CutA [Candidatus Omnitrophota bacterium]
MKYIVVLITTATQKEAEKIANSLVNKKLAACVNIVPHIKSIYHWQGKIEKGEEFLLVVKSKRVLCDLLFKEVKKNHSYKVPEIIAIDITEGYGPYLRWLMSSLKPR